MNKVIEFIVNTALRVEDIYLDLLNEWDDLSWGKALAFALLPGLLLVAISYIPSATEAWQDVAGFVMFLGGALLIAKLYRQ